MAPAPEVDPRGFKVSLLGGFSLVRGAQEIAIKPSEQRLIAFLALRRRPAERSQLAGALWPDTTEAKANARLRTALWRCNQEAGDGLIHASSAMVGLNAGVAVDVHDVVDQIDEMTRHGRLAVSADQLALDLLDSWYDDWVLVEQESHRQRRLHALDLCCQLLRDRGQHAEALDAGLAAVAAEPLRESAHKEVIMVHLAEGNVAEAMRHYQLYETLLWAELGLRPTAVLLDLLSPEWVTMA